MCEYEQRNLAIIEAIMLDLGVSDIEELPAKVHEIKVAAQHRMKSDVCHVCHGEGVVTENGRLRTCVFC